MAPIAQWILINNSSGPGWTTLLETKPCFGVSSIRYIGVHCFLAKLFLIIKLHDSLKIPIYFCGCMYKPIWILVSTEARNVTGMTDLWTAWIIIAFLLIFSFHCTSQLFLDLIATWHWNLFVIFRLISTTNSTSLKTGTRNILLKRRGKDRVFGILIS